jgi:hypothetical protein
MRREAGMIGGDEVGLTGELEAGTKDGEAMRTREVATTTTYARPATSHLSHKELEQLWSYAFSDADSSHSHDSSQPPLSGLLHNLCASSITVKPMRQTLPNMTLHAYTRLYMLHRVLQILRHKNI